MRLEQVDPGEKRRPGRLNPALGARQRLRPRALRAINLIVVDVEPAVQAVAVIEHDRADERGGRVSRRLQPRWKRRRPGGERGDVVVVDPVARRIQRRQQRGVRRQRERRRREDVVEDDGITRQRD